MAWSENVVVRAGVRLVCRDHAGAGSGTGSGTGLPVVLLHGLAGHLGEWDAVVRRLSPRHRMIAVDQRGHGGSERYPKDVSRDAYVAGSWLDSWPVPFASRRAAAQFLGDGPVGQGWAAGLEQRDGGWWPRFDRDVMVRTIAQNARRSYWPEWNRITCPTLVVLAQHGIIPVQEAENMLRHRPSTRAFSICAQATTCISNDLTSSATSSQTSSTTSPDPRKTLDHR